MKLAIVVIARDPDIISFFHERRARIIPSALKRAGERFNVVSLNGSLDDDAICNKVLKMHSAHDAVAILAETADYHRLKEFSSAMFLGLFCSFRAREKNSLQNYFGQILARWIRNFRFIAKAFTKGSKRKCLMLPPTHFEGKDLEELVRLCCYHNSDPDFIEKIEKDIKSLRHRSSPKTHQHNSYRKEYLVDDNSKYFELGKEQHGQAETARPPHKLNCELSATARFGVTIDRGNHFNVSLANGNISGNYPNCHNEIVSYAACTHLNVFPNGCTR